MWVNNIEFSYKTFIPKQIRWKNEKLENKILFNNLSNKLKLFFLTA